MRELQDRVNRFGRLGGEPDLDVGVHHPTRTVRGEQGGLHAIGLALRGIEHHHVLDGALHIGLAEGDVRRLTSPGCGVGGRTDQPVSAAGGESEGVADHRAVIHRMQ